jgi:hypothetical protein
MLFTNIKSKQRKHMTEQITKQSKALAEIARANRPIITHADRILAEFSDLPPHIRKLAKTAHETSENEEEFRDRLKTIRVLANLQQPQKGNKTMELSENLPSLMLDIRRSVENIKPMPTTIADDLKLFLGDIQIRTGFDNGEPVLCVKDLCNAIDIKDSKQAYDFLDDDLKGWVLNTPTLGGDQDVRAVTEVGACLLLGKSRKPEAKAYFRKIIEFFVAVRSGKITGAQVTKLQESAGVVQTMTPFSTEMISEAGILYRSYRAMSYSKKESQDLTREEMNRRHGLGGKQIAPTNERYLTPTEIGKRLGGLSAIAINRRLVSIGYQFKNPEGKWAMTEAGKEYGRIEDEEKAHCVGTIQQLKWRESVIEKIVEAKVS